MSTIIADADTAIPDPSQKQEKRHRPFVFLKGGFSIFLMWWILEGTNFGEIFHSVQSASVPLLVCAFCLPFAGYYLSVSRWRLLLSAQGVPARIAYLAQSFIISVFFNNFLPSTIGGDVFRVYESWRLGASKSRALAVVFVDRLLGLMALFVLAMVGILAANPFADVIPYLWFWVLGGGAGIITLGVFLFHTSFPRRFNVLEEHPRSIKLTLGFANKMNNGFSAFRGKTGILTHAFGLSLLLQGNVVLPYFVFAEALHFSIPFLSFFLIIPLALFVMLLPISINGIGLRESVFVLFLGPWGIDKPDALALAWLAYGSLLIQGLIGGLLYASRK